jgi:hypothetical protein
MANKYYDDESPDFKTTVNAKLLERTDSSGEIYYCKVRALEGETLVVDKEHYEIHEGNHYYIHGFEDEDADGTIEFVITTPDDSTRAHMTFQVIGALKITVEIYEGSSSVVGGGSVTPLNNDRNSSNTSGLTIIKDPTSITDGTKIDGYSVGYAAGAPVNFTGGIAERNRELILKQNQTYLLRITSNVDANTISYKGSWYEEG